MRDLREILGRAASVPEAHTERLLDAVPSMLARARAERSGSPLVAASHAWLPRLAGATVLLVLTAVLLSATASSGNGRALESWIVSGAPPAVTSDPVLDAILDEELER